MEEERKKELKPEPQHLLQHEFSTIVFVDYMCERPFDLLYQERTIQQYQSNIIGELISIRTEIRDSWIDNRIEDGITQILSKTGDVAREHGFSQSIRKQSMKILLPIMIGFFVVAFAVIFLLGDLIPENLSWLIYVVYAALLLVICIVPRLINKRLLLRWQRFGEEFGPQVKSYITPITERLQKFVQFLIDDVRKILAQNNLDLANYRLMLFNPQYQNVKIIQEEVRKSVKFYVMELLPLLPLGVTSETPKSREEKDEDDFSKL